MKIEITEQKKVPLLSRERITATISFEGPTPSRDKLLKEIAKELKVVETKIIIKHIYTRFGVQHAKAIIHVYETEQDLKDVEEAHLVKKHTKDEPAVAQAE